MEKTESEPHIGASLLFPNILKETTSLCLTLDNELYLWLPWYSAKSGHSYICGYPLPYPEFWSHDATLLPRISYLTCSSYIPLIYPWNLQNQKVLKFVRIVTWGVITVREGAWDFLSQVKFRIANYFSPGWQP